MADASPLIEAFIEMLSAERGAASNTLAAYSRDLADFAAFLKRKEIPMDAAGSDTIQHYLEFITAHGFAASTLARRLSSLRQFHHFLLSEGIRSDDPTAAIEGPKPARNLPRTLGETDIDRLIRTARENNHTPDGARTACLIEILYATGLRVTELVSLPLSAARNDPRFLLVRGKGGR